jgi:O-antigen/teichoic acid export membrane protein
MSPCEPAPEQFDAAVGGAARRFVRNSSFGSIAGVLTVLTSFLSSVVVAHVLGVAGTGMVAFGLWIASLAVTVADLGIQASLMRYLPELVAQDEEAQAKRLTAFLLRLIAVTSLLALLGFVGWGAWLGHLGFTSYLEPADWIVIGIVTIAQAFAGFGIGYLRGLQHFDRVASITLASFASQIIGVFVGSVSFGVPGALCGYGIGSRAPAALCLLVPGADARVPTALKARVQRFALFAWAGALLSGLVWNRLELFFLQRSWGNEAVGLFNVGLTLGNLAAQGAILLTAGLLPYFAQSFAVRALPEIRTAYATGTRIIAFIVLPICFGAAAVMPELLPLIYGQRFADAVPAATIIVAAGSAGAIGFVGAQLINALERSDFVFVCGLAGAVLSIVGGLTVIPWFGLTGAAWARAGIQVSSVAFGAWFINRRLACPTPFTHLARLTGAAVLCALAARGSLLVVTGTLGLLPAIVAGAITYVAAVRFLGALPDSDIDRLRSLSDRLPKELRSTIAVGLRLIGRPSPAASLR